MKFPWLKSNYDRLLIGFLGLLLCVVLIGVADFSHINSEQIFDVERGRVIYVISENLWQDYYIPTLEVGSQMVEIEVLSGTFAGEQLVIWHQLTRFHNFHLTDGMAVLVSLAPGTTVLTPYDIAVYSPTRGSVLIVVLVILAVGLLVVGRSKGFYALVSLVFTFIVIIYFLIHGIVSGGSPVFLAIVSSLLIITFATGMISGVSKETLAAVGGAVIGLLAAGLSSFIIGNVTRISGIHLDGVRQVLYHTPLATIIGIQDLFFAVVIIATTGAMIDSSISIASSAFELNAQSKKMSWRKLYQSSMQIARSVLGANVNTLILAFAGTSLVTLLLIVLFGFPTLRIINLELVAIEIILGASATIGMLVGIPATAFFASFLAAPEKRGGRK